MPMFFCTAEIYAHFSGFCLFENKNLKFNKPSLSIEEHITLLKDRGLVIPNELRCYRYIKNIGYYRLSAYLLPFQESMEHNFNQATCFDDVLNLYVFDRKLRLLLLDIIERIDISLRAQLIDGFCCQFGAHGYLKPKLFHQNYNHTWLIEKVTKEVKKSHETFIQHYMSKYTEPKLPPFWMVAQVLTFSELSQLITNLKDDSVGKSIANSLDIKMPVLSSWLKSLSHVRNVCAHHGRLWNRVFGIKPKIPKKEIDSWSNLSFKPFETIALNGKRVRIDPQASLFNQVVIAWHWINSISTNCSWLSRFEALGLEHKINFELMGFNHDWRNSKFWDTEQA